MSMDEYRRGLQRGKAMNRRKQAEERAKKKEDEYIKQKARQVGKMRDYEYD
ncbi:MAG: hypothetical protein ACYCX4_12975 [Bacillota bacterium]